MRRKRRKRGEITVDSREIRIIMRKRWWQGSRELSMERSGKGM